jgi:hypothetical protein
MKIKMFELRDVGTFIPIMCVEMLSDNKSEKYLLKRLGFGDYRLIQLVWISANRTEYDPFKWGDRTFHNAHKYIVEYWDELKSGDIIDVQYILGEREIIKRSEKYHDWM